VRNRQLSYSPSPKADRLESPTSRIEGSLTKLNDRQVSGIAIDLLPGNHAIVRLARQMETSDAAKPFYRKSDHWRAARA